MPSSARVLCVLAAVRSLEEDEVPTSQARTSIPVSLILELSLVLGGAAPSSPAAVASDGRPDTGVRIWPRAGVGPVISDATVESVAAASPEEALAVGSLNRDGGGDRALRLHWDGTSWRMDLGTTQEQQQRLLAVDLHTGGAFAVGRRTTSRGSSPLIQHWLEGSWHDTEDVLPTDAALADVDATADDGWAVGGRLRPGAAVEAWPYALRWDGRSWHEVDAGHYGYNSGLSSVLSLARDDAWAVGHSISRLWGPWEPLVLHWDRARWHRVPVALPRGHEAMLFDVTRAPDSTVLVLGQYRQRPSDPFVPMVLRLSDGRWSRTSLQDLPGDPRLSSLAANSARDAWIVGRTYQGYEAQPLALRLDGGVWQQERLPDETGPLTADGVLAGVAADGAGGYFFAQGAAGARGTTLHRLQPAVVGDSVAPHVSVLDHPGEPMVWRADATTASARRLVDDSGLGLFASRALVSGSTFSVRYPGPGRFRVRTDDGDTSVVDVALGITRPGDPNDPPRGRKGESEFILLLHDTELPPHLAVDVQVRRPGEASFTAWSTGARSSTATFGPVEKVGTYAFRGRVRDVASGVATPWSPERTLVVLP